MAEAGKDGDAAASSKGASIRELIRRMLISGERGARIARACRSDEHLLRMLVEQKKDKVVNGATFADFKTLADVLIQEVCVKEIGSEFPAMQANIRGEEVPFFKTAAGEAARIRVCDTEDETKDLLLLALQFPDATEEDRALCLRAAAILADIVHAPLDCPVELPDSDASFDPASTGIWIDPLDSTNGFISGRSILIEEDVPVLASEALLAVSVLIGAFDMETGLPFAGVVNQPFFHRNVASGGQPRRFSRSQTLNGEGISDCYQGRSAWGVDVAGWRHWDLSHRMRVAPGPKPLLVHSNKEKKDVIAPLRDLYELRGAPGAGYKLLCVIDGTAHAFVLSSASTYKWDTCGPHAIVRAMGGVLTTFDGTREPLYHVPDVGGRGSVDKLWANEGGLLVASSREVFHAVHAVLAGK